MRFATPSSLLSLAMGLSMLACATTSINPRSSSSPEDSAVIDTPWTSAEAIEKMCAEAIADASAIRAQIKDLEGARTVDNTVKALNALYEAVDPAGSWATLIFNTHPDEAVRAAAQKCQAEVADFRTDVSLDPALYQAFASVDVSRADPVTQRYASHVVRDFQRAGVDQDDTARARLEAIQARIVEISQAFGKNVRSDVRSILVDPASLSGLPEDYIAAHPPEADGRVRITTDYPDFFPFQTYCGDGALREELYNAFMARAHPANAPLMAELLALRHETASLLGHPNWASYHAGDKMAHTSEIVDGFIRQLKEAVTPKAEAELAELLTLKRQDDPDATGVEVWDRFYYVGKLREQKHGFDARTVRPYFSFERVTAGILDLYGDLFGLSFEERTDRPVWDPSVKAYDLRRDGAIVGHFFLDMHPRDGKYKHAAAFDIHIGATGGHLPMGTLVCNFPDPADGDGKALLEHGDVVTYFHEFGHLIHLLMAQSSPFTGLNGFNVEWDFVEAPSQLLEEWAWHGPTLARFATHVDTGEAIPADLVRQMREADEFGKGLHVSRQIFYTAYSFYLHSRDPSGIDLGAFTDEIYRDYSPYRRITGDHIYSNFGHLLGYSSGYYTYQWSLVIAKDLFSRFEAEGLLNTDVARDYRRLILEPGGTKDAADLVEDFLGRPYNMDAYRAWLQR